MPAKKRCVVNRDMKRRQQTELRRACGRAKQVFVYTYSGNSAQVWWSKALATLAERGMQWQCFIQDGEVQMMSGTQIIAIELTPRMAARE